jgi:DNA-binding CsgD family transcriptional regulator
MNDLPRLIQETLACRSVHDFGQMAVAHLRREVPFDFASFLPFGVSVPLQVFDMPLDVLQTYVANAAKRASHFGRGGATIVPFLQQYLSMQERYDQELRKARVYGTLNGYAYIDTEVYDERERRELALYRDLVHPQGIASMIVALSRIDRWAHGVVNLCRVRDRFQPEELEQLRPILEVIGLLHAACHTVEHQQSNTEAEPEAEIVDLSGRERYLIHLVGCGYTNPEIASALKRSPNTVRNQLALIFEKIGVSTRSELTTWAHHNLWSRRAP